MNHIKHALTAEAYTTQVIGTCGKLARCKCNLVSRTGVVRKPALHTPSGRELLTSESKAVGYKYLHL